MRAVAGRIGTKHSFSLFPTLPFSLFGTDVSLRFCVFFNL